MNTRPYHRPSRPAPQSALHYEFNRIDLSLAHLPPYAQPDASNAMPDLRGAADALFDARAAAAVRAAIGDPASVKVKPRPGMSFDPEALLEFKSFGGQASDVFVCAQKIIAAVTFADYFPAEPLAASIRAKVSEALLVAGPGWCGTFGPIVDSVGQQPDNFEGDYEFAQMFILPLVYVMVRRLSKGPDET